MWQLKFPRLVMMAISLKALVPMVVILFAIFPDGSLSSF
jgi:hypothetical protein